LSSKQKTLFIAASTSWNEQDWNSFQLELCLPAQFHLSHQTTALSPHQLSSTLPNWWLH